MQVLRTDTVWFCSSMISNISVIDAFIGKAPDSVHELKERRKRHFSLEMMV